MPTWSAPPPASCARPSACRARSARPARASTSSGRWPRRCASGCGERTAGDHGRRPDAAANWMGPVINAAGRRSATAVPSTQLQRDGQVLCGGRLLDEGALARGYFVAPTVASAPLGHRLWRDELFLPLVLVGEVDSLDEAITRANDSDYGLTAGFYGARGRDRHASSTASRPASPTSTGRRARPPAPGPATSPSAAGRAAAAPARPSARSGTCRSTCASSRRPSSIEPPTLRGMSLPAAEAAARPAGQAPAPGAAVAAAPDAAARGRERPALGAAGAAIVGARWWTSTPASADDFHERHYNEFVTFLPYVQRFLYGDGRAQRDAGAAGSPMRLFRRRDVAPGARGVQARRCAAAAGHRACRPVSSSSTSTWCC